jgi:hypothetical protein
VYIPLTLVTLALFTALIVVLRIRWGRLSSKFKRCLLILCLVPVSLLLFSAATRLSTTSDRLNTAVYWGFVLGYIFFVSLFTLLRPVWFTSLIAIILILPLLSASAILPLAAIFSRQAHRTKVIGDGLITDLVPLDAVTRDGAGADIVIYRRISWAPFLRRREQGARYFNTQCNTSAAYAVLQPDGYHLQMVCPATPGAANDRVMVVKLFSH